MLLAYGAVMVFNAIWLLLVGTGAAEQGTSGASSPTIAAIVLVVLGVAIAAPIVEELVFRGYLFPARCVRLEQQLGRHGAPTELLGRDGLIDDGAAGGADAVRRSRDREQSCRGSGRADPTRSAASFAER